MRESEREQENNCRTSYQNTYGSHSDQLTLEHEMLHTMNVFIESYGKMMVGDADNDYDDNEDCRPLDWIH